MDFKIQHKPFYAFLITDNFNTTGSKEMFWQSLILFLCGMPGFALPGTGHFARDLRKVAIFVILKL